MVVAVRRDVVVCGRVFISRGGNSRATVTWGDMGDIDGNSRAIAWFHAQSYTSYRAYNARVFHIP